jgi:tRNA pseudouridine55 synthase
MNGFINLLKPSGMSSSSAVAAARAITGQRKSGHSGTLDPLAAGVLPLCLGRATKLFDYIMEKDKEYLAELTLGAETDTQDADGEIVGRGDPSGIGRAELEAALAAFRGRISQKPPMYSALVHEGRKLYKIARGGGEVERSAREIDINRLEIAEQTGLVSWLLRISCSKGTYVRTLCADIGRALGCYGYLSYLLRTASGVFVLADTVTLEELSELSKAGEARKALQPMDFPLAHLPRADFDRGQAARLADGMTVAYDGKPAGAVRLYADGAFFAIGLSGGAAGEGCLRVKTLLIRPGEDSQ